MNPMGWQTIRYENVDYEKEANNHVLYRVTSIFRLTIIQYDKNIILELHKIGDIPPSLLLHHHYVCCFFHTVIVIPVCCLKVRLKLEMFR